MANNTDLIGAGEAYETNQEWEIARDGEAGTQTGQLKAEDGGIVTFNGVVGSMVLEPAAGAAHIGRLQGGTVGSVARIEKSTSSAGLFISSANVTIRKIAIHFSHNSDGAWLAGHNNIVIDGCLFHWNNATTSIRSLLDTSGSAGITGLRITNNVNIINNTGAGDVYLVNLRANRDAEEVSHNSSHAIAGNLLGVRVNTGCTLDNLYNNALLGATGISNAGTITNRGDNATSDTTGDSGHTSLTDTDVFEDPANGDLRPVADSNIYQAGTDRTAQADLDADAIGTARTAPVTIGALEPEASGGSSWSQSIVTPTRTCKSRICSTRATPN